MTDDDKTNLKLLLLKGLPESDRAALWFVASGAKLEMNNNPNYYSFLINNYPIEAELPSYRQIDLVRI